MRGTCIYIPIFLEPLSDSCNMKVCISMGHLYGGSHFFFLEKLMVNPCHEIPQETQIRHPLGHKPLPHCLIFHPRTAA